MLKINLLSFKKSIVVFWALWWLIALWTDVVGVFAHFNLLNASWAKDLNYPFLVSSLKMYNVPNWFSGICLAGIILWSFLSTALFISASLSLNKAKRIWLHRTQVAFIVSVSYWLAFFLADQMIMNFDLEQNHMVQGGFQLLTFLSLYILPDE